MTNRLERDHQIILENSKLKGYFDVLVGIDITSGMKLDREVFLYAVSKLGVRIGTSIFIGESVAI